ncbi:MAG: prepilin peptidase [Planctomycetes bacterium]|nr:prepilin peptidase [Planctomycetota bacterium]
MDAVPVIVPLLAFLAVATVTDIRTHKIFNWNTYPGIIAGFLVRAVDGFLSSGVNGVWSGLTDALVGFLLCGFVMLFCFVLFNVGGGDVKLIAMMGAFLGLEHGVEALLWTFVLGGAMGVAIVIWRIGFLKIVANMIGQFRLILRARGWVPLTDKEREPLQRWLFLAPSAFVAVVVMIVDAEYHYLDRLFGV